MNHYCGRSGSERKSEQELFQMPIKRRESSRERNLALDLVQLLFPKCDAETIKRAECGKNRCGEDDDVRDRSDDREKGYERSGGKE